MSLEVVQGHFCVARVQMEPSPCVGGPRLSKLQLVVAQLNALLLKLLAQLLNFLAQLTVFLQQLLEGASVVMAHDGSQGCNCSSIHGSERKCEAEAFANALFDNTQLGHFR